MGARYIGYLLRARPARVEPAVVKMGGLDRVLEGLQRSQLVYVDVFHTCVCIYVWFGLLWRQIAICVARQFCFHQAV